jgi:Tfp pilus assembly protein PilF
MVENGYLAESHKLVDDLQRMLYEDPAVSRLMKRRANYDIFNEELLSNLDKEQESLKKAGKRLKVKEAKVDEEAQLAVHAGKALQAQSVWKDYWACHRVDELTHWLQLEKAQTAELSRKIFLYEARFGRLF